MGLLWSVDRILLFRGSDICLATNPHSQRMPLAVGFETSNKGSNVDLRLNQSLERYWHLLSHKILSSKHVFSSSELHVHNTASCAIKCL